MKIEIETDDFDVLESYSRSDGHREWGRMSWLYPGDVVAQISGESAARIAIAVSKEIEEALKREERA